jgi:hypothetical protein
VHCYEVVVHRDTRIVEKVTCIATERRTYLFRDLVCEASTCCCVDVKTTVVHTF